MRNLTLLPQLRLSFFYSSEDHISNTGSRKPVEAGVNSLDSNNIQVLGARVVTAVHDSCCRQGSGNLKLNTNGSGTTWKLAHQLGRWIAALGRNITQSEGKGRRRP